MRLLIAALILAGSALAQDAKVVIFSSGGWRTVSLTSIDGRWVAKQDQKTYTELSVSPGEHKVCFAVPAKGNNAYPLYVLRLQFEPGKTYYIQQRSFQGFGDDGSDMVLIGEDQAQLLMRQRKPSGNKMSDMPSANDC
jgi:hypothetical protein